MGFDPLDFIKEEKHGPFYKAAKWLWRCSAKERVKHPERQANGRAREALCSIYGEQQAGFYYKRFQISKYEKLLTIFAAGMAAAVILTVGSCVAEKNGQVYALDRPQQKEGTRAYELNVQTQDEKLTGILVEVPARALLEKEKETLLQQAAQELDGLAAAWNLDALEEDLALPNSLQNGLVDVRFESSCYDLLDGTGHVNNGLIPEEGSFLQLHAVLTCQQLRKELVYPVHVMPRGQDLAARLARETARQIQAEETKQESETFILPDEFEGRTLIWKMATRPYGLWIGILTAFGCVMLNMAFEKDLEGEGEKRRENLLLAYPSFLTRLTLLAGTGMPLRMAFSKMAEEGAKEGAQPVYEEVLRTCREMDSGFTELQAYENFGKRCRLPQYKKCASLLAQNVRKGTGGLLAALNQEAENAFEERKALARRKGEEAQTRMLLPMLMMLAVVMILLMVPACFSLGGW